jgi:hypothetical protein
MKKFGLVLLLLTLFVPVKASALQADDLVAVAAMPLAVAAVSELTDVPANELMDLVATMNQAQVPAPQVIEVVRYAPVALVDTEEPFVPYITSKVNEGVTGQELALVMEDRIERYEGAESIDVVHAPRVVVVDRNFYPEVVVTRFQPVVVDPLALVAMPLAVAAVSRIADVPSDELISMISLLNQARVPPAQFVEIVRYSPVALVDEDPQFLTYVTTQVSDGRRGMTLARLIEDRYETLGIREIDVVAPPAEVFVAPVAVTRVAVTSHAPGQVKKQLGLQTGAEVVHGSHPGRGKTVRVAKAERSKPRKVERVHVAQPRAERAPKVKVTRERPHGHGSGKPAHVSGNSGGGKPNPGKGNSGKGNSGKGKGKG